MQQIRVNCIRLLNCYRAFGWKCYRASAELLQSISGTATELIVFSPVLPYHAQHVFIESLAAGFESIHVASYVGRDWMF